MTYLKILSFGDIIIYNVIVNYRMNISKSITKRKPLPLRSRDKILTTRYSRPISQIFGTDNSNNLFNNYTINGSYAGRDRYVCNSNFCNRCNRI